jgi:hypothetical protein
MLGLAWRLRLGKPWPAAPRPAPANARNPDGLPFSARPPALGGKELVAHGIVDHRGHQRSVVAGFQARRPVLQPHRNAELRKPVSEVGRPVQRVHVPAELAFHPLARALFAVDSVLGKRLAQPAADQLLHRAVGHGHQVYVALVLGLHALGKVLAQPRARLARNLGGLRNKTRFSQSPAPLGRSQPAS